MRAFICIVLIGCAFSTPQGYNSNGQSGQEGGGRYNGRNGGGGGGGYGPPPTGPGGSCPPGEVPQADGKCVTPEVMKSLFVYGPPAITTTVGPPPYIPKPKINYNVVFVHTPKQPEGLEPIVIPPPQQKTVVYVLSKNGEDEQQVIEIPAGPKETPKVFYVNYNKGENPSLPGGLTLQDALNSAIPQDSQIIPGGESGGGNGYEEGNTEDNSQNYIY